MLQDKDEQKDMCDYDMYRESIDATIYIGLPLKYLEKYKEIFPLNNLIKKLKELDNSLTT